MTASAYRLAWTTVLAALVAAAVCAAGAADDSWYQPLEVKAEILEQQVLKWHWIDGLYASQVEVPWNGAPVDHSTNGISNVMHTCCWTANHLAGESYRYAFIKKRGTPEQVRAVREHVNAIFEGMYRLQKVTGVRGFQARGYLYGHGPTAEERSDSRMADYWYQGAGEYQDLRWRGSPSHHNYSDAIHGYGVYYRLAAEGEYKEQCRQAIDDLVSIWADSEKFLLPTRPPQTPGETILGLTDGKTPNLRTIMAAAGLKVAHVATGKEKFQRRYEELVSQYGFRTQTSFRRSDRLDTDDAEHVFGHLDNLFHMEKDPKLLAFYRVVLEALWAGHKESKCPLFNYTYLSLTPDAPDRQKYLDDALWTLQSHPTNTFFQPRMNSLRDDLAKQGRFSKEPMAVFEAAWDNEYLWKGHLYQLDGWLSRIVVALDAAGDDPEVLYAADEAGDLYRSGDGAKSWQWIGQSPAPGVLKIVCGPKRRLVFLLTAQSAFRSTTGGASWTRLPVPAEAGQLTDLQLDQAAPNRLYLVTRQGVFRSLDFGEKWTGQRWENLTPVVPPGRDVRLVLAQGYPAMLYALCDGELRSKPLEQGQWSPALRLAYSQYVDMYPWLLTRPGKPADLLCAYKIDLQDLREEGVPPAGLSGTLLSHSRDSGATWTHSEPAVMKLLQDKGGLVALAIVLSKIFPHSVQAIAYDPREPATLYAATQKSLFRSRDDGRSWAECKAGLDIPKVQTIFTPASGEHIYVGTPAGLYRLKRGQDRWQYANLRLQFEKNTRRDLGGAAYLDAYWRGRYFGFITDLQATQDPAQWNIPARYRDRVPARSGP
ncbi:MAG: WD40/YVTN/BNR-like repeat-containing protein [Thermoguttaceae bacterium]